MLRYVAARMAPLARVCVKGSMADQVVDWNVGKLGPVGIELQVATLILAVASRAVLLVMATCTGLRIILSLERMHCAEVAAMTFGFVIPAEILGSKIHA